MAGSLACNAPNRRLLATHNKTKNTHEALSKASRHGRINDRINRTVEKGKKIDAEHAKIITVFSHVIALLELRYDRDHKVGRPGNGEAQHDNQNHFAHLPGEEGYFTSNWLSRGETHLAAVDFLAQ